MISRTVYVNGQQHLLGSLQPGRIFVGHKYFGDDAQRRNDYRLPFRDAFSACGYEPLFPNDLSLPGGLLWTLTQEILNAGASIFDVTGCNANVLIELGIALGMNLPVLTICEAGDATLPDFLNELAPLRYPSRAALKRTVVETLTQQISAYASGRLNPRYCVACKQECASRRSGLWSKEEYLVVGVSEETDEDFFWNVEETLQHFQPAVYEDFPLESQQAICRWVERLQRAKIALFSLHAPHHGPETAYVYVQLGLAVGLGVPWTMILHEKEPAPVDLRGMAYVARGGSDILFRSELSNAIRGLLLENRVVIPDGGLPLPYIDEPEDDDEPELANDLSVDASAEDDLELQQRYQIVDDIWPTFSQQTRGALRFAVDEAQQFNHDRIGTEHLLMGLLREREGVAAKALANLGVELDKVYSAVEFIIGRGERTVHGEIGPDPRTRKVIDLAVDEARRLNHHYIGTEHLLLGLVREGEGIAAGVLESLGVSLEKVRNQTIRVLSGESQPAPEMPPDPQQNRDKFDKFTEHARHVLASAQDEARRFNHNYIGTEHLLLGLTQVLMNDEDDIAARVLANLGVNSNGIRSHVEFIIGRGERIVHGEIELSPRSKKVVELAVDEARRLHHTYIGTEHLLLGLVREGEGIAAGVLADRGVTLEKARTEIIRLLSGESEQASQTSPDPQQNRDKFDKFTRHARKAIELAVDEAQRFNHNYVGTEHLLLGMIREGDGVAAQVLTSLGVQLSKARAAVEFIVGRGDRIVLGEIGLSSRAKKVVELAVDEARRLNQHYIGTEHLLLGMIREGEGIAAGVLESLGVNLEKVRSQTIQKVAQSR